MSLVVELLKNEYRKRKLNNQNYSLRSYAKWLRISLAQLSQMMSGKRTVTLASFKKLTERLEMSPVEIKRLRGSLLDEKGLVFPDSKHERLQMKEDQFRLIADWYHLAILSLTKLKGARPDPRWIATMLNIKVEQAGQALFRLQKLGLISQKPFKQITDFFEISSKVPSLAIQKYHKQNLQLAAEKLETVCPEHRQYQSISLNISPHLVPSLKRLIDDFLDAAAELDQGADATDVYHLNVQLFPVTHRKDHSL